MYSAASPQTLGPTASQPASAANIGPRNAVMRELRFANRGTNLDLTFNREVISEVRFSQLLPLPKTIGRALVYSAALQSK